MNYDSDYGPRVGFIDFTGTLLLVNSHSIVLNSGLRARWSSISLSLQRLLDSFFDCIGAYSMVVACASPLDPVFSLVLLGSC
jgi:hypothetical protein